MRLAALFLTFCAVAPAAGVRVLFDPRDPALGPFPTDFLTTPDHRQKTGRRIDLPLPDCGRERSSCFEIRALNELDGFSLLPRLRVRFSGRVDTTTLHRGVFLYWLDRYNQEEHGLGNPGKITPLNQWVYDPRTDTLYAKPDEVLDQTRRYMLLITDAVRDLSGDPVERDGGFDLCLERRVGGDYCADLAAATARYGGRIAGASLFSTMTATAWLESARRSLSNTSPSFERTGIKNVFPLDGIARAELLYHLSDSGERFHTEDFPLPLELAAEAGAGSVAFGAIHSPVFVNADLVIPSTPTGEEVSLPPTLARLPFHVWLPRAPAPEGGYPVVIAGHGLFDSRFGMPSGLVLGFLRHGFAIVAMNAFGHGFGPDGSVRITEPGGSVFLQPLGGRGVDVNGDGRFDQGEGSVLLSPERPYFLRETLRQTAVDLMQLARAIRAGMDLDGDGTPELNGTNISYVGQSFGGYYGTLFHAVEPHVGAAVINVAGATAVDAARWSPTLRIVVAAYLGVRQPPLLNRPPGYDEDYVLRYEPVKVTDVPGAIAIQNALDRLEWLEMPGAPAAFAPHLRSSTLPGVPIKRTLFQVAVGDRTVPNPANLMLIRAANEWESASMYRADVARRRIPSLPGNPHAYLVGAFSPAETAIALAAQEQAAAFLLGLQTDVNAMLRPLTGVDVFEPVSLLLEQLNFEP